MKVGDDEMGQADVISYLEANPGWHKTDEVVEATGLSFRAARNSLSKMASWREIERAKDKKATLWRAV